MNIDDGKDRFAGWDAAELALLRELWRGGVGLAEIARRLGRSSEAVRSRARRLRLPPRRSRRPETVPVGRERPCLACGGRFSSQGPHNRLCEPCREAGDDDFRVVR